jgi:hypothetical protein
MSVSKFALASRLALAAVMAVSLATVFSASRPAQAEEFISIGGGAVNSIENTRVKVLLRVEHASQVGSKAQFVVANIKAQMSLGNDSNGDLSANYVDVAFEPLTHVDGKLDLEHGLLHGVSISLLPAHFSRNVDLGQGLNVKVSAIAVEVGGVLMGKTNVAAGVFGRLGVDAVGGKLVRMTGQNGDFVGTHILGGNAEAGFLFRGTENVLVRLSAGGGVDINKGRLSEGAERVQDDFLEYDFQQFVELRVLIAHHLELFARATRFQMVQKVTDGDAKYNTSTQFQGGALYRF